MQQNACAGDAADSQIYCEKIANVIRMKIFLESSGCQTRPLQTSDIGCGSL